MEFPKIFNGERRNVPEICRPSYDFANKFLKEAGIESKLIDTQGNCADDKRTSITLKVNPFGMLDFIKVNVVPEELDCFANLIYSRAMGNTEDEVFQKVDILRTVNTITKNSGQNYTFRYPSTIKHDEPAKGLEIESRFDVRDYKQFAGFIGCVDKIISLYLGCSKIAKVYAPK
jgi:hypothetical protein